MGDYIGLDDLPGIRALVGKREKVEFAGKVSKYDRRFKVGLSIRIKRNNQISAQSLVFVCKDETTPK